MIPRAKLAATVCLMLHDQGRVMLGEKGLASACGRTAVSLASDRRGVRILEPRGHAAAALGSLTRWRRKSPRTNRQVSIRKPGRWFPPPKHPPERAPRKLPALRVRNTSPDSSVSIQASASTASTRPESGTLCSRFAFILDAGTVHVVASRSNSSHQGRRGSLPQDHGVLPTPNPRGDPEDHEPIDRKRMARLSSQMSRSHHPVEKAMAPVPVREARQSFPPFDGVFSPFKHGSIRHGRTARTADRAVLVELRRFLAGVHAHWDVPDVQVLDRALPPASPEVDNRVRAALIFLLGGLGAGLGLAFVLDRVDTRIQYASDVTDALGLEILGTIPVMDGGSKGGDESTRQAVEAFRNLRVNLEFAYGAGKPLALTLTSPDQSEGKSTLVANLASGFAAVGRRTLVIDGDTRRGDVHRMLDAQRKPGLTDFLQGDASLAETVQATKFSGVHLIASGSRFRSSPELLASRKLWRSPGRVVGTLRRHTSG